MLPEGTYTEAHHIVPECLGGPDSQENMVNLLAREHFIAHQLLAKANRHSRDLVFAAHMMTVDVNGQRVNNRRYGWLRKLCSEVSSGSGNRQYGVRRFGEANHFYGKHHTEKTKADLRTKCANYGEDNGFHGKHHTDETKATLRHMRSLKITVEWMDGESSDFESIKQFALWLATDRGLSISTGSKLCQSRGHHLWSKYNIKRITKHEDQ